MVGSAREGVGGIREIEAVKLVTVIGESTWGFICLYVDTYCTPIVHH